MTQPSNAAFWQDHLQAQEESGLTQVEYFNRHDLKFCTFKYWRKAYIRNFKAAAVDDRPRLLPVTSPQESSNPSHAPPSFSL